MLNTNTFDFKIKMLQGALSGILLSYAELIR